jgi:hypothetical protein
MKNIHNPWESISGAVCLNIFMSIVTEEPKKSDDLVLPICCSLYISNEWNALNFSKTDNISELRNHISTDVSQMKEILLGNPEKVMEQVKGFLDHLNGSLAFSVVVIQAVYNSEPEIYKNNLKLLFQESWEIIFWYLQDLKDNSIRKIICDFAVHHVLSFKDVIKNINAMNPL